MADLFWTILFIVAPIIVILIALYFLIEYVIDDITKKIL
jgi:hypothetical protein